MVNQIFLTQDALTDITDLYNSGHSMRTIARCFQFTEVVVRRVITEHKIPVRELGFQYELQYAMGTKRLSKAMTRTFVTAEQRRKIAETMNTPEWSRQKSAQNKIYYQSEAGIANRQARSENISQLMSSGHYRQQVNTLPEQNLRKCLQSLGLEEDKDFIPQYRVSKRWVVDFAIPDEKIAFEADGDYFHANPANYPNRDMLNSTQKHVLRNDESKNRFLKNHGWHVCRLWESNLADNPNDCVLKIINCLFV